MQEGNLKRLPFFICGEALFYLRFGTFLKVVKSEVNQ